MKQVIRKGIRDIIVDEVPDPVVTAHHVLIRPVCSLISSGTESAAIHQEGVLKEVADNPSHLRKIWEVMKVQGPLRTISEVLAKFNEYAVIGYSGAGVVAEKHPTVTDLEIGQRVAYGGEGTGHAETILTGRNLVARLPDGVPFDQACFATLGSIAMNAVRIAGLGLGDRVAVIGLGLVGQLIAQLARLQGGVVLAIDLKAERVEQARKLGADHAIAGGATLRESVADITNGVGADCVIVAAAAKSAAPCRQALEICRDRGRLVIVGAVDMSFPWNDMYLKEIQLFMSRAYGPGSYDPEYEKQGRDYPLPYVRWTENRNMEEFLRLCASSRMQVAPLITHRYPLDQAPAAYQTILDPATQSLAVVLDYPRSQPEEGFQPRRKGVSSLPAQSPGKAGDGELGVALAGAAGLARWSHLPNLRKIQGARLRAVYSTSGARGKSLANRFQASYCSTDYGEILKDPDVGMVLITSRNQHHAAQALGALRAGKHVFVEKPMAINEAECRDLALAVKESGKQLTVGFNRRFAPFYLALKKQLARRSGPAVLNCRVNSPGISGSFWMADPAVGGAILGEACHFIDVMFWLLDSEPLLVSAYSLPTGKKDPIGENNLVASFSFADGSIGSLTYSTVGSKTSAGERVEAFAPGMGAWTEDFKRFGVQTALRRTSGRIWPDKGYAEQLSAFIEGIRKGSPPQVTVVDGVRSTIGCLRMLDSSRERKPFAIDLAAVSAGMTSDPQTPAQGPPIRVLLIAPSLRILGGQSVQATRLLGVLGKTPGLRMAFQPINPEIGFLRRIKYVRTATTFLLYCLMILARSWRYDIIHVFSAAYYSYSLWTLPALFCARLYGRKIILNYRDGQAEDHLANWRSALPTIRRMDAVVTPSGFLVEVFKKFEIQATSIFNIIDMSRFRYRQRRRLRPVFLHNRILEPLYDVETTLRAFSLIQQRYPEASLTIAHDGISRPGLEQFAASLHLRNTRFVGRIPHPRVADLYDEADLYLTNPLYDCMPGSLLECFASGLPVIATAVGGIPYIAQHEKTALLIPAGDHQAMAAAAFRLLEDEALVERLTRQAFESCKRYDGEPVRRQWNELYHRLAGR